jgi:hypothetical protein
LSPDRDIGLRPSGGRFNPRLARETGSSCAANLLYPGVEISMSIGPPSMRGVDIVATFHWTPCVGSRRISVIWKPELPDGRFSYAFRVGDCPAFFPALAGLESKLCRPAANASYFSFQFSFQSSSPRPLRYPDNALHRFIPLSVRERAGRSNGGSSPGTGGSGRRRGRCGNGGGASVDARSTCWS